MISLKPLIMNPKSPDRALEQAWSIAEGALARLAHVNRLARDVYDIKTYQVDLNNTASATFRLNSKKGIVNLLNAPNNVTKLFITITNPEIVANTNLMHMLLSVYSDNTDITPIIVGRSIVGTDLNVEIRNIDPADSWGNLYFYYSLVKLDE